MRTVLLVLTNQRPILFVLTNETTVLEVVTNQRPASPDVVPGGEAEAGQGGAPGEEGGQGLRVPHRVTHHTQPGPENWGPDNRK